MEVKTPSIRLKNVKIFYRILPTLNMQWEHLKLLSDMKTVYVSYLQDLNKNEFEKGAPKYWKFDTDGIFYNNTQEYIYNSIMLEILDEVIGGSNAVILCYGQTGTGKSLTTAGLHNSFKDRGLAPRILTHLFNKKEMIKDSRKMSIQLSCIETNRTQVRDLLSPTMEVLDAHTVKNVTAIKVNSERHGFELLFKGESRRIFSQSGSKNHIANGVITIHVHTKPVNQTDPTITSAKIHLVDLAGGDSCGNTTSLRKKCVDVGNANLAKSHLEQFIMTLCKNISGHILVKRKLNVLIQYLADSLHARSIIRCIGHIRTDLSNLPVSLSMLRFGCLVCRLKPQKIQQNITTIEEGVTDPLIQAKLDELYKERDLNAMLTNESLAANITQDRIMHMQNVAEEYLRNKTNEIVLLNVTDATTVLRVFKSMFETLENEKEESVRLAYEKAYEDAMRIVSKTDSLTSSKRLSKKSNSSKDIGIGGRAGSSSKRRSISKDKTRHSSSKLKTLDQGTKSLRRSKASNSLLKRSSTTRKKSNGSSIITGGTALAEAILEEKLPGSVPDYEEAWQLFILDVEYNYEKLAQEFTESEEIAKNVKTEYLSELHNLHKAIELLDHRKNESCQAEMQRLFQKQKYDEAGFPMTSNIEQYCKDNLQAAHSLLLEQQEKVLKCQGDFQVALSQRQNCQRAIDEHFEKFCQDKYNIEVPSLKSESIKEIEDTIAVIDMPEEVDISGKCVTKTDFDRLREIMEREIKKLEFEKIKHRKWVQSCKM